MPARPAKTQLIEKTVNIKTTIALICAAVVLAGAPVAAIAADAANGQTIGYSCLGCHGVDGYRNAYPSYRVPKLGGQKAAYLVAAIKGYRDGTRAHPTMTAQATSLSDQQIEDVAAYLASGVRRYGCSRGVYGDQH